ncbi:MAG: hypothetical protein IJS71_08190 [Clostridia bacterium]|nr:hypothetical protein [Clostridia bacterium]
MSAGAIAALVTELASAAGIITAGVVSLTKIFSGQKCLLRSEMLRIYYHNREQASIRQYEYENFVMLYEAYKGLKGNSFIDKIYEEVKKWKVVS